MNHWFRKILTASICGAILIAGWLSATHTHSHHNDGAGCCADSNSVHTTAHQHPGETSTGCCCCHHSQADSSNSESGPVPADDNQHNQPCDHHDSCVICQLLAQFHCDSIVPLEFESDSLACDFDSAEATFVAARPLLIQRGRAPPAC